MTISKKYEMGAIIESYCTRLGIAATRASGLADRLQQTAPTDLTAEQRAKLAALVAYASGCDGVLKARRRLAPSATGRRRNGATVAWSSLDTMFRLIAGLPREISPHGEEAMSLQATLQIPASAYATLDAQQVWTESKRTLERIDEEGLAPRIEHIGAGPFLANARFAAQQLGEATAHTGPSPLAAAPSKLALIEARDRFRGAVMEYTVSLAGDLSTSRPGSYERFMAAVAPIDEIREASKSAGEIVSADGEDEVEDDVEDDVDDSDDDVITDPAAPVNPDAPFTS